MDDTRAKEFIRKVFESEFSKESFTLFIHNLLNVFDKSKAFHAHGYVKEIFTPHIKTYERLGTYTDPNNNKIDILIVYLQKETSIERARSMQRNFVAEYLKGRDSKDAALVAFVSPDPSDWRFSFVKMEYEMKIAENGKVKVSNTFTPVKRYSFLVGPHEASHTAQSRMLPHLKNSVTHPTLAELEELFSVEKVTNEFFDEYKELFADLVDSFSHNDEFIKSVVSKYGIDVADFSKKLMGQIVFLYFLQKKGWLGVKEGSKWGTGDKFFMTNLYKSVYGSYANFFNDILEPLFYDTLNRRDRGNSSVMGDQSWSPRFHCKIPYLNGGLFTPAYEWDKTNIKIENERFQKILEVFDKYNFTVYEPDPIEKEVAVDPEMLGKVFERLLDVKDRKGRGAFYTPREIVQYMCRESLITYLKNNSDIEEKRIRDFFERKDHELAETELKKAQILADESLRDRASILYDLLKKVKICDPAVGSGAFPMGLLKEISSARHYLNTFFIKEQNAKGQELTEYDIKKQTLENCIYGVDIEPGAVEIARLRFWLALIVEHDIEDVEPLPNLDYKIMQGNSLLDDLMLGANRIKINLDDAIKTDRRTREMKNLFQEEDQDKLFSDASDVIVNEIKALHHEYFKENDPIRKKELKIKIDTRENELIHSACDKEINRLNECKINSTNQAQKSQFESEIASINMLQSKWNKDHIRPFFSWKLHFSEIFEEGGFDIVIGNPPYVQLQKLKGDPVQLSYKHYNFETYDSNGDIYCLFYEKGLTLTKSSKGILCYITSNKWMRSGYGAKLRSFMARKNPLILIDMGPGVFDNATVDTNILLVENNVNKNILESLNLNRSEKDDITTAFNTSKIRLPLASTGPWFIGNSAELKLKEKIESVGVPLNEWNVNVFRGVLTGLNEAFIIDTTTKELLCAEDFSNIEIIKPILRGRDIDKYVYDWADQWIIFLPWHFPLHNDSNIEGCSSQAELKFMEKHSSLYRHLLKYKPQLLMRNKAETGIRYEWYALQRCAATYYPEFNKEKVIWQEMSSEPKFAYDNQGVFCNDTGRILTGEHVKFFVGLFNSLFFKFTFAKWYAGGGLGEKGVRYKSEFMKRYPIPAVNNENEHLVMKMELIIQEIIDFRKENPSSDTTAKEKQIDLLIYKLYELTEEEIRIIETGS